jgi:hypothetical protein
VRACFAEVIGAPWQREGRTESVPGWLRKVGCLKRADRLVDEVMPLLNKPPANVQLRAVKLLAKASSIPEENFGLI